jgi:FecR protein.
MVTNRWLIFPLILFILISPFLGSCRGTPLPDFAVLSQIQGKIKAGSVKQMVEGANGMLLRKRHRVKTEKDGKVTILFKDGSEVRLFTDSELILGAKKSRNSRWMRYKLLLLSGSLWGHFVRGKDPIEISGGTLRLLLSDTSIRLSKKKTGTDISVLKGSVRVFNKSSFVKLNGGQRLYQIKKNDFMPQKISVIPNQLKLSLRPSETVFRGGNAIELNLNLQVVRYGSDRNVERQGPIYFRANYYNLVFPDSIRLNTNGNAKAKVKVTPPSSEDRTFGGSVTFHAIIDQKGFDDVRDGH